MPKRDYDLSPHILAFVLWVTFFAVTTGQARHARTIASAIERSRPSSDELAAALRTAARKTRAEQSPPPVPAEQRHEAAMT